MNVFLADWTVGPGHFLNTLVGVLEVVAELAVVVAGEIALFAGVGALVGPQHGVGVQGPLGVLNHSSGGRMEKFGRAVFLRSWWHHLVTTSGSRQRSVLGSVVLTRVGARCDNFTQFATKARMESCMPGLLY